MVAGRLRLTDPDNLLDTGIELEARPSGKNVRKLSLLSGGERSLTALAFLFAVFRSRPSPFYVMDEVEAALDDVNLHRFLGLVAEFRDDAQLIIVSHQKRTMEAADCLYGVTMQPGGSSKVVSGARRQPRPPLTPTKYEACRRGARGGAGRSRSHDGARMAKPPEGRLRPTRGQSNYGRRWNQSRLNRAVMANTARAMPSNQTDTSRFSVT